MDLKNMKLPPPKEKEPEPCCVSPREEYPWGLRLHLQTEQLEQLGIEKLPDVETEVQITARAKVTSVNSGASAHDKQIRRSVELQITDLALAAAKKPAKESKDVFYGEG